MHQCVFNSGGDYRPSNNSTGSHTTCNIRCSSAFNYPYKSCPAIISTTRSSTTRSFNGRRWSSRYNGLIGKYFLNYFLSFIRIYCNEIIVYWIWVENNYQYLQILFRILWLVHKSVILLQEYLEHKYYLSFHRHLLAHFYYQEQLTQLQSCS